MNKIIIGLVAALVSGSALATKPDFANGHDNRPEKTARPSGGKPSASAESTSSARASASAAAAARASSVATGGNGTGGSASATGGGGGNATASGGGGGNATASGGQVIISSSGNSTGLTGRMVPDVSTSAPLTSTSCRNGISAGGSGNGWGGLLGFFAEDDLCEWRLLESNYRATGDHDKANAIRAGMTAQRCEKLAPKEREMFGDLCPKPPASEPPSVAFSSAG